MATSNGPAVSKPETENKDKTNERGEIVVPNDFTDDDADERGWITYRETRGDGKVYAHTVPVCEWATYERKHKL